MNEWSGGKRQDLTLMLTLMSALMSADTTSDQAIPLVNDALVTNAQSLFDQVKTDLNLTDGEVNMFIPDMPNVPHQDVPVMIAQANQAQSTHGSAARSMGVCFPVSNNLEDTALLNQHGLSPKAHAVDYFNLYEKQDMGSTPAIVSILQGAKHGELAGDGEYLYLPEKGYLGQDKAIFLVDFGDGHKVKVIYYFHVVDGLPGAESDAMFCGKTGHYWKISSNLDANGNSTITSVDYQSPVASVPNTTLTNTSLNDWLSLAQQDGALANLTGLSSSRQDGGQV